VLQFPSWKSWSSRLKTATCDRPLLVLLLAGYTVIISIVQILRYETFVDAWDFAGYAQAVWSASHGSLFQYTLEPFFSKAFPAVLSSSFLATHFSPILGLFVPFVALAPSPGTLLVLQASWCAASGFFIYKIARLHFDYHYSLAIAAIYLVNPVVLDSQFSGLFHTETFAFLSSTLAMYGLLSGRHRLLWAGIALTLATIEVAPFVVIPILVVYYVRDRSRWKSTLISLVAVLGYLFLADFVRGWLGLDTSLTSVSYAINSSNWRVLGAAFPIDIPFAIVSHPGNVAPALSYGLLSKLAWIASLFEPLLFVPLLDPLLLLPALPWMAAALLSNYSAYYSAVATQTAAFVSPFILVAAVMGLSKLNSKRAVALTLMASILCLGLYGPFSGQVNADVKVTQHDIAEASVLNMIPSGASVLTTSEISPHLAMRAQIYQVPPLIRPVYANVSQELLTRAHQLGVEFVISDLFPSSYSASLTERKQLASGFNYTGYGLYIFDDGVIVYKLGWRSQPILDKTQETFGPRQLSLLKGSSIVGNALQVNSSNGGWFGPYVVLPPGNYQATFNLVVNSGTIRLDVASGVGSNVLSSVVASRSGSYQLNFTLAGLTDDLEFRGLDPSPTASIELLNITVATG